MLNPQLNRQGRLVHLLSTEGLSRELITALLDAADRHMDVDPCRQRNPEALLAHWRVAIWRGDRAQAFDGSMHPDSAVADGDASLARLAQVAAMLGAQRAAWPGDTAAGDPAPSDPAPSDPASSDPASSDPAPGDPAPGDPAPGDPAPSDPAPGDTPWRDAQPMSPDLLLVRHSASGAAHWAARRVPGPRHVINAGDGTHEDPVSGLTMVAALRRALPDLTALTITLVGNLNASAAGRSCLHILTTLGVPEVRLATPPTLAPEVSGALGVQSYVDVDAALAGTDVVVVLPSAAGHGDRSRQLTADEYRAQYGLSAARLAAACAGAVVLLAPGIEHGVEVIGDLAPMTRLPVDDWRHAVSLAVLQTLIEGEA